MAQSLVKMYTHIIFSTKHRQKLINKSIKSDLQAYLIGVNTNSGSYTYEIYAHYDHIHIFCLLPYCDISFIYFDFIPTARRKSQGK